MGTAQWNFFSLSVGILNIHVYQKNQEGRTWMLSSENKPFCAQCILEKLSKNNFFVDCCCSAFKDSLILGYWLL